MASSSCGCFHQVSHHWKMAYVRPYHRAAMCSRTHSSCRAAHLVVSASFILIFKMGSSILPNFQHTYLAVTFPHSLVCRTSHTSCSNPFYSLLFNPMELPEHFESVLRRGREARARRRRSPSPVLVTEEEVAPDQYPTFTRPISPELNESKRYTTERPKKKHANPWLFRRDSNSTESGDDCDQPLTRQLSRKASRKASAVLSMFTPQRTRSDASNGPGKESSEESTPPSPLAQKKQGVTVERRRSSFQKIRDIIAGKRKDSANSEKAILPTPPLDDDDRAMGLFEKPSPPKVFEPTATDSELLCMTGALSASSTGANSSSGIENDVDAHSRVQEAGNSCRDPSHDSESAGTSSFPVTNPHTPTPEADIDARMIDEPIGVVNASDDGPSSPKHKRSRHHRRYTLPNFTSIRPGKGMRNSTKKKLVKRMPASSSAASFNIRRALTARYVSPATPAPNPTSADEIGVIPLSSVAPISHITLPTFTDYSPTTNSSTVALQTTSYPHTPSKSPFDDGLASPQIDPTTVSIRSGAPSGSPFALPSPFMDPSDAQQVQTSSVSVSAIAPFLATPAPTEWPSCVLRRSVDDDRQSTTATIVTIVDTESTHEDLRLRRSESLLNALREAAAAVVVDPRSNEDRSDMTALRELEALDGVSFASTVVRWSEECSEDGCEGCTSRGRSRDR
ncbi:hypothetical protein BU23DRAFT_81244 [Bimuria novae-zelandiae CBS 107.79]|uniref:Uncharacterized protein n=1 Tax=Bimuria novae-zelandiae CBS 107.79 TaxID=1447943 RepID=A0A6A5VDU1_9PLEO|nr:hypothetical protein BU23DRAFT_81244 [Bimuria novae-zelandiae CBS 107.79]